MESPRHAQAEEVLENLREAHPTPDQVARWALEIYYGAYLDDVSVSGAAWSVMDCARESPQLAALLADYRLVTQQQLGRRLSRCGYSNVAPSLVTAVLDGSVLSSTIERLSAAAETAIAELAGILRQINRK